MQKTKTLLVMKLSVLLLTAAFFQVHASGVAQSVSLTGKGIPLKKVFSVVEKQTGYFFFYNRDLLKDAHPVSVAAVNQPLTEFLTTVFGDQPLSFRLDGKNIILARRTSSSKQPGLTESVSEVSLPPIALTGRIVDEKGAPISGVNIL